MRIVTHFLFLFCVASTVFGAAFTVLTMLSGTADEASKSLFLTCVFIVLTGLLKFELSDEYIPEYRYQYRGK